MTQAMLYETQNEVRADFRRLDSRMSRHDLRFDQIDLRFEEVDKRFDELEHKMDARFHELKILIEEQNARKAIALDGLTSLFTRQERFEDGF